MKANSFKLLFLILILVASVITFVLNQYNKPHEDTRKSKPSAILTAQSIIDEFQIDEKNANRAFTEKIIQIEGVIAGISTSDGNSIITLGGGDSDSGVICLMSSDENIKSMELQKQQLVVIKGKCTGFLLDVMMVRCVLISIENE